MASLHSAPKQTTAAAADSSIEAQCDLEAQSCSDTVTRLSDGSSSDDLSSNEGCAGFSDASVNPIVSPEALPDASLSSPGTVAQKSWRTRRSMCCLSCCSLFIILITLSLVFLRPRDPEWQVQKLIVSPAALQSCIKAITKSDGEVATIGLDTLVDFSNPNYIGAEAGEGRFAVTWEGHELASVTTDAKWAPARKHSLVTAHSTSVITPELGKLLMQTLPSTGFSMQVHVKGELQATVRALFGLKVTVSLECTVDTSVLLIMSDPDKLVTGHQCTYGVRF